MKIRIAHLLVLFISCTSTTDKRLSDFDKSDFDEKVKALNETQFSTSQIKSLSDSITSLQRIIRNQIEFLDGQDSKLPFFKNGFIKEFYSKSISFPERLSRNLNFIDSVFHAEYPEYSSEKYGFSPRQSFETSNIPFQREFFTEAEIDIDTHQKFLCALFLSVRSAESDFYEFLKSNPSNEP